MRSTRETGHLVYAASGTLRADRFDLSKLEARGESVPVIDKVRMASQGSAAYSVSKDGTLVYVQAVSRDAAKRTLVWVDREGREEPLSAEAKPYSHPRLSPDGTRLAVNSRDQDRDIWIFDLSRQTLDRLTSGGRPRAESRLDAGQSHGAVRVAPRGRCR